MNSRRRLGVFKKGELLCVKHHHGYDSIGASRIKNEDLAIVLKTPMLAKDNYIFVYHIRNKEQRVLQKNLFERVNSRCDKIYDGQCA